MIALLVLACSLYTGQESRFAEAMRLTGEARFVEAENAAAKIENPVEKAQARIYLRLQAGDLFGAMRDAEAGARVAPNDLWILERRASTTIALGTLSLAERATDELTLAVQSAGKEQDWASTLASIDSAVETLREEQSRRDSALLRSRLTVAGSLILLLGLLWRWTRPQRAEQVGTGTSAAEAEALV